MPQTLTYEKLKRALDRVLDPDISRPLASNPRGQRYFIGTTVGCNKYLIKLGVLEHKRRIPQAEVFPANWYTDGKQQLEYLKRNNVQKTAYVVNLKRAKEISEKLDKMRVDLEDLQ